MNNLDPWYENDPRYEKGTDSPVATQGEGADDDGQGHAGDDNPELTP